MSTTLKGKFFNASRGLLGDNSVKYMNIELSLTNANHDDYGSSFDWGNNEKGSKLLASAILSKIGTPTISRIYTNKFTESVIQKLTQDSWKLEATEVAKWINTHTDYSVEIEDESEEELEKIAKEKRRIQREKEFQEEVQRRLKEKEKREQIQKQQKKETLESIEKENKKFQETINEYKIKINKLQDENRTQKTQIDRYKQFIKLLDIESLKKKFNALDDIEL